LYERVGSVGAGSGGATVPSIKEKTIRAIAMTSINRSRVLPDVPTLDETVSKRFRCRRVERVVRAAGYARSDRQKTEFRDEKASGS
jgi:tripartite-type tricarboxylate transporter receptor subunit TctC